MIFDYYKPTIKKDGKGVPGTKAEPLDLVTFNGLLDSQDVKNLCNKIEQGERDKKTCLPAICWNGKAINGYRKASEMMATQYYMVDVDHVEEPSKAYDEIVIKRMTERIKNPTDFGLRLVHITPSGKGLRFVCRCVNDFETVEEHMEWLNRELCLDKHGDFDTVVKDLSRLSFAVPRNNVLFFDEELFSEEELREGPIKSSNYGKAKTSAGNSEAQKTEEQIAKEEEERRKSPYWDYSYNGSNVRDIAQQWVDEYYPDGVQDGRKHSVYNQMVKDFRHICDNNPVILHVVLPRFEPTTSDRLNQCTSICKVNNYGTDLPPKFELFLRKYGYIKDTASATSVSSVDVSFNGQAEEIDLDSEDEEYKPAPLPKKLPPVFREVLGAMPEQFKVPAVNALLPVLGTMTPWLRSVYPTDQREQSTTFFSVIYAPPATGKSFIEQYENILLKKIRQRDDLCQLRDDIVNSIKNTKADSKDGPKEKITQCRIIPARNSLGETLKKMTANNGRHAYTYCAEIDEWSKGVKAAGNDKDDLVRKAWDNGEYGQMFASSASFKGRVKIFWNLLLCGTPRQMFRYFKDTENGLVSRCSFTPIEKKRFSIAPRFKPISKASLQQFEKFIKRCDERTYKKPLVMTREQALQYAEDLEAFDREVPWDYEFQPLINIDLNWLFNEIERWQKVQNEINAKAVDEMADDLIPRVMIRGFRLGLLCHALWDKVGQTERNVITDFVKWWMTEDLHYITELWRDKRVAGDTTIVRTDREKLFDDLPNQFGQGDYIVLAQKYQVSTRFKQSIFFWKKKSLIKVLDNKKKLYEKI